MLGLAAIKEKRIVHDDLTFPNDDIDWYSEALLPHLFQQGRGDNYRNHLHMLTSGWKVWIGKREGVICH